MDLFTAFNSVASNAASAVSHLIETGLSNMPEMFNQFNKLVPVNFTFPSCFKAALTFMILLRAAVVVWDIVMFLLKLVKAVPGVVKATFSSVSFHSAVLAVLEGLLLYKIIFMGALKQELGNQTG